MLISSFIKTFLVTVIVLLCNVLSSYSQEKLEDKIITFSQLNSSVYRVIEDLGDIGITFSYASERLPSNKKILLPQKRMRVEDVMELIATEASIKYKIINEHIAIKVVKEKKISVSGFVYDVETGEQLIAASVYNPKTYKGTFSNNFGHFSLSVEKSCSEVCFSYTGYELKTVKLSSARDTFFTIFLNSNNALKEIVVNDETISFLKNSRMSSHALSLSDLESQPMLLGEKDALKAIQLLPGVQANSAGSAGISVRGGSHSHNLILIDDVPVYNIDHLIGVFSVFNPDAIKRMELYKGAFPARYGGRVSSILDVRTNEGDNENYQLDLTIGMLTSKFKLEGPIKKNKTSFMISGRRTNYDLLFGILSWASEGHYSFGFGDIYTKINHRFSDKSRLYLSLFYGSDRYEVSEENINDAGENIGDFEQATSWRNYSSALRWNYLLNDKLFLNTTVSYSGYDFVAAFEDSVTSNYNRSGVDDLAVKLDFDLPLNDQHFIRFGAHAKHSIFKPSTQGGFTIDSTGIEIFDYELFNDEQLKTFNIAAYLEDDIEFGKKFRVNIGFRYNFYHHKSSVLHSFEPRISGRYLLSEKMALKFAYTKMSQNVHFLSNSYLIMPYYVWVPTTNKLKPQISEQVSLGINYDWKTNVHVSIEAYRKDIENTLLFDRERPDIIETWEDYIEQGRRRIYGLEFMIRKTQGKLNGWLSYSLTKAEDKYKIINGGNYTPFWPVREHSVTLYLNQKFGKRVDLGVNWVFSSGMNLANKNYTSLPDIEEISMIDIYSDIDFFQMETKLKDKIPANHRLDFCFNIHKEKKRGRRTWSIGVYNVYSYRNTFLVMEKNDKLYLGRIGTFMPFFQYRFKFN